MRYWPVTLLALQSTLSQTLQANPSCVPLQFPERYSSTPQLLFEHALQVWDGRASNAGLSLQGRHGQGCGW